ncbi:hypothetical protein [Levilactobacillus brevis]|uniref:hypothetical protein n=1 Tax=Levilactobacillus brevis TaxID=1580 RepID=UPI003513B6D1
MAKFLEVKKITATTSKKTTKPETTFAVLKVSPRNWKVETGPSFTEYHLFSTLYGRNPQGNFLNKSGISIKKSGIANEASAPFKYTGNDTTNSHKKQNNFSGSKHSNRLKGKYRRTNNENVFKL